jgi:hypothetical protein
LFRQLWLLIFGGTMLIEPIKQKYQVRNWKEYNQSLVNRGKITLWFNDEAVKYWIPEKKKQSGRPFQYSQIAIETALMIRYVFNLPLRATEGFLTSIFSLLNLQLPVPDYTLLCKRGKKAPQPQGSKDVTDIVVDATGVKVFGEGEWKVKQHGRSKKGKWRKFHIGLDPKTGEVVVHEATKSGAHDSKIGCRLIGRLKKVEKAYGDGAYDTKAFYQAVTSKGGKVIVPPRRGGVIDEKCADTSPFVTRNQSILEILGLGGDDLARSVWKKLKGYHVRSLVETWFSRFKRILGGSLRSHHEANQNAELAYKVRIMNRLTTVGMPVSCPV